MVIAGLTRQLGQSARLVAIHEGTQLLDELDGCQRLIVIDACCSSGRLGTISRFRWPDHRIRKHHNHSTHGIGLCNALELAARLDKLPKEVEVFGIEIRDYQAIGPMSVEVLRSVHELQTIIHAELCEAAHA
jgi:hydrogenase maturation protease